MLVHRAGRLEAGATLRSGKTGVAWASQSVNAATFPLPDDTLGVSPAPVCNGVGSVSLPRKHGLLQQLANQPALGVNQG